MTVFSSSAINREGVNYATALHIFDDVRALNDDFCM